MRTVCGSSQRSPMNPDTPSNAPTRRGSGSPAPPGASSELAAGRCIRRRLREHGRARAPAVWYIRVPMAVALAPELTDESLIGDAPASPAGPLDADEPLRLPPARSL